MIEQMMDAVQSMNAGRKKPGCFLMSPVALTRLIAQSGADPACRTFAGLPIHEIDTWSRGWLLLTAERANAMGIKLP